MKNFIILILLLLFGISAAYAQKQPKDMSNTAKAQYRDVLGIDSLVNAVGAKADTANVITPADLAAQSANLYDYVYSKDQIAGLTTNWFQQVLGNNCMVPLGASSTNIGATLTTNRRYFAECELRDTLITSKVIYGITTAGNYTGANENCIVLYSKSATTITEIDRTATDSEMWKITSSTVATKNWAGGSHVLPPGKYVIGWFFGSTGTITTAPQITSLGIVSSVMQNAILALGYRPLTYQNTQTTMPSSLDLATLSDTGISVPMIIAIP